MSSAPNTTTTASSSSKASSTKKIKALTKGNVVDFESLSLLSLKKYRSQFQIRIKPSVPKSELAAAIAEHFASIPVPEETEVIDQFLKALQKTRNSFSETEESANDEPVATTKKSTTTAATDLKKRFNSNNDHQQQQQDSNTEVKNSSQSNTSKKLAKRNSIPKVEKAQTGR